MNLVVTGATSFLGVGLMQELLRQGHQVYAIVRPHSKNLGALQAVNGDRTLSPRLHLLEMELEELDKIGEKIKEPCDIFFHFGWDGSGSNNRMRADVQQKNVDDSMKALWGAKNLGCNKFVFSGSQAEYGVYQTAMREDLPCYPVSEYGKAKVKFCHKAQELCRKWREQGKTSIEYIHARIFSVYGPGDHPWSLVNTCLDTFLKNGRMELGACTQKWNFLYIEDLVKGLLALAFCENSILEDGIYNLAGSDEETRVLRDYVKEMYRLCNEKGSYVYGKLPPNAEGPANLIPDTRKIYERTGWKPEISFEEGIKRMLEIKNKNQGKTQQKHCCILCGQVLEASELMELTDMPASAQDIPDEEEVENDQGITLHLHQCPRCGLVQFDCGAVGYYRDVIRSGGYSTTMVNLRSSQYKHLIETYHLEGKKFLEVGCGRGEFLKVLTKFPVKVYGVEHKKDLVTIAVDEGLDVVWGFTETEDTILGKEGPYDVFLSFNFLEHQPNPGVMLNCIWNNLSENGMGLITVPSLEYILQFHGYYELLRDHIAYYTFDTLRWLLEHHGFEILEEEMINRDTLSVIVRKIEKGEQKKEIDLSVKPVDISGLISSRIDIFEQMENLCNQLKKEGKTLAIWGASHQGFTLAATTVLKEHAKYIIDSTPFKQGRFAPASHLPIKAPEYYEDEPVDVILIAAPGYTEEIADAIRNRFGKEVEILALRSDKLEIL